MSLTIESSTTKLMSCIFNPVFGNNETLVFYNKIFALDVISSTRKNEYS